MSAERVRRNGRTTCIGCSLRLAGDLALTDHTVEVGRFEFPIAAHRICWARIVVDDLRSRVVYLSGLLADLDSALRPEPPGAGEPLRSELVALLVEADVARVAAISELEALIVVDGDDQLALGLSSSWLSARRRSA